MSSNLYVGLVVQAFEAWLIYPQEKVFCMIYLMKVVIHFVMNKFAVEFVRPRSHGCVNLMTSSSF